MMQQKRIRKKELIPFTRLSGTVRILVNWPENSAEIIYLISWVVYCRNSESGNMRSGFETTAFNLKKDGDISQPYASAFGYHIIKRVEDGFLST